MIAHTKRGICVLPGDDDIPCANLMRGMEHISQVSRQGWLRKVHCEHDHFSSDSTSSQSSGSGSCSCWLPTAPSADAVITGVVSVAFSS